MRKVGQARSRWAIVALIVGVVFSAQAQSSKKKQKKDAGLSPELIAELAPQRCLVLVQESNPWIGLDHPTLALYGDGTLIYVKWDGQSDRYLTAKLTEDDVKRFLDKISSLRGAGSRARPLPIWTIIHDAPGTTILVRTKITDLPTERSVWGTLRHSASPGAGANDPERNALEFLRSYEYPQATQWIPESVEVVLTPAKESSPTWLEWPSGWPTLENGYKFPNENEYWLRLNRMQYVEMEVIRAKSEPNIPWRIEGKLWKASVRFLFPHEMPMFSELPRQK